MSSMNTLSISCSHWPVRSTEITPNPSHQATISTASNNNGSSTAATSQPSISSSSPVQNTSRSFTLEDINDSPDYEEYVRSLAEQKYPSLNLVLEFLKSTSEHGSGAFCSKTEDSCILCHYFRLNVTTLFTDDTYGEMCVFDKHTEQPSGVLIDQMLRGMIDIARGSQPKQPQRLIILVEDIRPRGMKVSFPNLHRIACRNRYTSCLAHF
jgi:hypothetical protein